MYEWPRPVPLCASVRVTICFVNKRLDSAILTVQRQQSVSGLTPGHVVMTIVIHLYSSL